jgi:hypothetical protein
MWKRKIARLTCSTRRYLLPLLPSGPDGVCNPPLHRARLSVLGGERGIRTPGTPLGAYTRFPVVLLQPLGHLSGFLPQSVAVAVTGRIPAFRQNRLTETGEKRACRLRITFHERASPSNGKCGGERGIRTPVGACGPQIDFESIPLRPLRYLSANLRHSERAADDIRFSLKNPLKISAQISL